MLTTMNECLFISLNNINTTQYRYEDGKAMKHTHATDIVSVMYKCTYIVSYNLFRKWGIHEVQLNSRQVG